MVFKTENGKRVFDCQRAELSTETIHPDMVPETAPHWESMKANLETERKLMRERDDLHVYQQRLDAAHEAAGGNNVTAADLTKMDAYLKRDMPDAVRAKLPDAERDIGAPQAPTMLPPGSSRSPSLPIQAPAGP